jgi:hypothetical protein
MRKERQIKKEHNDLPCTSTDNLLPAHDLSTMNKQFITRTDGSFDHAKYFHSHMQPSGCIGPLQHPAGSSLDPVQ